jgi:uncharacterized membrane protein
MASPASIKKHPIHPILVALPIGLWTFALVCDVVRAFGMAGPWATLSLYSIAGGIVGGLLAAIPGVIDYLSIDEAEMKRIGTMHLLVNVGGLLIFSINFWSRFHVSQESKLPLILSVIGVGLIGLGGWLGGEMVYVKGMAVEAVEREAKKRSDSPRLRRAG